MQTFKQYALLLLVVLTIMLVTVFATLQNQAQQTAPKTVMDGQQAVESEEQLPIAEYSSPQIADTVKRTKRQAKSEKYNNSSLSVDPSYESTTITDHWANDLSALPVERSNAVIIGQVSEAAAYLSNDKTGVYSEFTILINAVLKDDVSAPLTVGYLVSIERLGGRVRFPSSRISQYVSAGQGMPRKGGRYVFFLKRIQDDYQLLTGYELRAGHVRLLDNPGAGHPITAYQGAEEAKLLNDIRVAITNSTR